MKALIVGQAPSRDTDGQAPFTGRSGARLADLLGIPHPALPRYVDLVNLIDRWPGKRGKGDRFPIGEARAAAAMLLSVTPHDRIVVCGGRVAEALGLPVDIRPLETHTRGPRLFLMLPHPSGVNLWWNDPDHVAAATERLRKFIHHTDLHAAV